jgi:hypothetical protein
VRRFEAGESKVPGPLAVLIRLLLDIPEARRKLGPGGAADGRRRGVKPPLERRQAIKGDRQGRAGAL